MRKMDKLSLLIISLFFTAVTSAQFKSQVPNKGLRSSDLNKEQESAITLLNPARFSMNHAFSLSMSSVGGRSLSYGIYSNRFNYLISNKWLFKGNFDLVQPTHSSLPSGLNTLNGQVYYGAELLFRHKNFQFSVGVDNHPVYYSRRPLNRYSSPLYYPY